MFGPFVHDIDPVIGSVGGVYLWWYGFTYTFGFLGSLLWLRANRTTLAIDMNGVYSLSIYLAIGVLVGGRLVEVVFYEWGYYGSHLWHIPAVWLGGMSTHGILLGAIIGTLLYCRLQQRSFFEIADVMVIAGAFIMGVGRIGNFIDGQIVGAVTDQWWGVKFPDLEGFRHPVVLYDGLKNLLLVPFLLLIRSLKPPRGVVTAHFILWYGFLRIFVDFFREYRTSLHGLPPGQEFNILMTLAGSCLLFWFYRKAKNLPPGNGVATSIEEHLVVPGYRIWIKRFVFVVLLTLPTVIPSDWTQDVPSRYGERHPGMTHSLIYPEIATQHTD
jgi:phosphatidylglycerol:prolipoprotein diacylglycerol transferase